MDSPTKTAKELRKEKKEAMIKADKEKMKAFHEKNKKTENIVSEEPIEVKTKDVKAEKASAGFDPFDAPVIEREYAQQSLSSQANTTNSETVVPQIEEDIPEPEFKQDVIAEEEVDEDVPISEKEPVNPALQDLSDQQKRKAAKETAKALMMAYCKFVPVPFKKFATISDSKVKRLAMEGKIDLDMQFNLGENTVETVKGFIDANNSQVDEIFTVDEETRKSIEEPLVEVLMEQGMALTPTQRLILAVGTHVTTMTVNTIALVRQNKSALETFSKFHADNMETKKQSTKSTKTENSKGETVIENIEVETLD